MPSHYGHDFPDGVLTWEVEGWMYRNWVPEWKGHPTKPKWEHMYDGMQARWPDSTPDGRHVIYRPSPWTVRRVKAWCQYDFNVWWGGSSTGKSTDAAAIIEFHCMTAPDKTLACCFSTTREMLQHRFWKEVVRLDSVCTDSPYKRQRRPPKLIFRTPKGDPINELNCMVGLAVQKGNSKEALGNLLGQHNVYNVMMLDEAQSMRLAALDLWDNFSTGLEAKCLVIGNPESRHDTLGVASEPIDGWESIHPGMESFLNKMGGITLSFDCYDSPALKEPTKYFFLLGLKQIESTAKRVGENSAKFMSQRRGWMPSEGMEPTVISSTAIKRYAMQEPAAWKPGTRQEIVYGFDPAFFTGGNRATFRHALVGIGINNIAQIEFQPIRYLDEMMGQTEDRTLQLARNSMQAIKDVGTVPELGAFDITGQQFMLTDTVDRMYKEAGMPGRVLRVNSSEGATTDPVSKSDPRPANTVFANIITELWHKIPAYGELMQIRGLDDPTCKQLTTRRVVKFAQTTKLRMESKEAMKDRTKRAGDDSGDSPDEADCTVLCLWAAIKRLGLRLGSGQLTDRVAQGNVTRVPNPGQVRRTVGTGSDEDHINVVDWRPSIQGGEF